MMDPNDLEAVIGRLEVRIRGYGRPRAIVALSGGVDSAVVLALAARSLGSHSLTAVTAVSPSYPQGELQIARELAGSLGVAHQTVSTQEVELETYARNDELRCFHCKTTLYRTLADLALKNLDDTVLLAGANNDDAGDFRPGQLAAPRYGVRNPLLDEAISKPMVRQIARHMKLVVSEKPALACLSSRVAYGIRITPELLRRIDQAENAIRSLGFPEVRTRHLGAVLAVELPAEDWSRLLAHPQLPDLLARLHRLEWERITLDLDGLRHGSLNAQLKISDSLRHALEAVALAPSTH